VVIVEPDSHSAEFVSAIGEPEVFVAAVMIRPAAWHAYGLSSSQQDVLRQALERWPSILGILGSMDLVEQLPRANVTVCTHSDMPPPQEALVSFLFRRDPR